MKLLGRTDTICGKEGLSRKNGQEETLSLASRGDMTSKIQVCTVYPDISGPGLLRPMPNIEPESNGYYNVLQLYRNTVS
jgi:hypothetical protein